MKNLKDILTEASVLADIEDTIQVGDDYIKNYEKIISHIQVVLKNINNKVWGSNTMWEVETRGNGYGGRITKYSHWFQIPFDYLPKSIKDIPGCKNDAFCNYKTIIVSIERNSREKFWKITISSGSLSCNGYFRAECSIPHEKYKTAMAVATKYLAKEVFKDMTTFDKFVKNNIK